MTITRQDIEAKAKELASAVDQTADSAKNTAILAGVVIAIIVTLAFFMGRRRGREHKTMVEVYRV